MNMRALIARSVRGGVYLLVTAWVGSQRPARVEVGEFVTSGTTLGYVGATGNARGRAPHLHFETRPVALGLRAVDPHALLTL